MPYGGSRNAKVEAEDSRVTTVRRLTTGTESVLTRGRRRLVVKAFRMFLMPVPRGINNVLELRVDWTPTEITLDLER